MRPRTRWAVGRHANTSTTAGTLVLADGMRKKQRKRAYEPCGGKLRKGRSHSKPVIYVCNAAIEFCTCSSTHRTSSDECARSGARRQMLSQDWPSTIHGKCVRPHRTWKFCGICFVFGNAGKNTGYACDCFLQSSPKASCSRCLQPLPRS